MTIPYRTLFTELHRCGIRYLVAGGFAVNLHQVQRSTVDLDLIVHLEKENLERFVNLMENLGYEPSLPIQTSELLDPDKRENWIQNKNMVVFSFSNPKNHFETVDVFVQEPRPFLELDRNKSLVKAFEVEIPVLGVDDLIDLKSKTGRDKDLFDVQQLRKKK